MDLSSIVELAVIDAEIETGRPISWLQSHGFKIARSTQTRVIGRPPRWSQEENEFCKLNSGVLSTADLANQLGRSEGAVHVHITRSGFTTPRHAAGYISGNRIAKLLGVDSHRPPCWIDLGILRGESFPYPGRLCRRVKLIILKMWLVQPTSWVYFKAEKISSPYLRRLVQLAQLKWGDEWWSTRQAADYLGCDSKDVLRQIKMKRIYGYHAIGMDRVREAGWSYWFVKKSEILPFKLPKMGDQTLSTPRADAFILSARAQGLEHQVIAKLMKWPQKRVEYRYRLLVKKKRKVTIWKSESCRQVPVTKN